jgi:hypothetical protein
MKHLPDIPPYEEIFLIEFRNPNLQTYEEFDNI